MPLSFSNFDILSIYKAASAGSQTHPFGLFKICQQDISKTIWTRGLKLSQLIGDDE